MTAIHRTAARGFDRGADAYERARPGYPSEVVEALIDSLRIHEGGRVLDLGAGTGKLTRELVARGVDCIALEPVEGMRVRFTETLPGTPLMQGTAEAIPLEDGSVDAIVVAQAFHWFRHEAALPEMHRVLRPGGRVGILWNVRDESHAWVARITEMIRPYEGADGVRIPRHREQKWRAPLYQTPLFRPIEEREFAWEQPITPEGLVDRIASISFIAILPESERAAVLEEVRLLTTHPDLAGRQTFGFPYVTEVFVFERA